SSRPRECGRIDSLHRRRYAGSRADQDGFMTALSISASRSNPAATAALVVAAGGVATIAGAYFFQYVIGLAPCPLCLEQRIPYYVAIPLALIVTRLAMGKTSSNIVVGGLALLAVVMLVGTALGV